VLDNHPIVWVVEWHSAVLNDPWTELKGVFSTKEAAEAYAQELEPKAADLTSALMSPSTKIYEFTLDVPEE